MSIQLNTELTGNEQKVLYGLVRFPEKNDKQLAAILNMKDSTLTSIKKRLADQHYFRQLFIPQLNRLGCEMLGIITTDFNPVIPLSERIDISKNEIEKNEEIFLSIGAREQGFSFSLVDNYTSFSSINEKRTEVFGKYALIDKSYPSEILFPFSISEINNFFDFSRILQHHFNIDLDQFNLEAYQKYHTSPKDQLPNYIPEQCLFEWFTPHDVYQLNNKEKIVFTYLIDNPEATMTEIGEKVGLSRHTVSRMKKKFFEKRLIKQLVIPHLKKIGFKMLVFYNFELSPRNHINDTLQSILNTDSTIFLASRKYKIATISVYTDYSEYKEDKMAKIGYLKENDYLNYSPSPRKFVYDQIKVLKQFNVTPITKKILKVDELLKKESTGFTE